MARMAVLPRQGRGPGGEGCPDAREQRRLARRGARARGGLPHRRPWAGSPRPWGPGAVRAAAPLRCPSARASRGPRAGRAAAPPPRPPPWPRRTPQPSSPPAAATPASPACVPSPAPALLPGPRRPAFCAPVRAVRPLLLQVGSARGVSAPTVSVSGRRLSQPLFLPTPLASRCVPRSRSSGEATGRVPPPDRRARRGNCGQGLARETIGSWKARRSHAASSEGATLRRASGDKCPAADMHRIGMRPAVGAG